jgi:hypothetical protein
MVKITVDDYSSLTEILKPGLSILNKTPKGVSGPIRICPHNQVIVHSFRVSKQISTSSSYKIIEFVLWKFLAMIYGM